MAKQDGGYYAIKGFSFQFDKTLLEILKAPSDTKEIRFENIQDLDSDDFVLQIKYKETQNFSNGKIKAPIRQLLDEFQRDTSKRYVLFCYFKDQPAQKKALKVSELETIFGSKRSGQKTNQQPQSPFTPDRKLLTSFSKKFLLAFADNMHSQFEEIISLIKQHGLSSASSDEATFVYANMIEYLKRIVYSNLKASGRKCTRRELVSRYETGRQLIFNTAFAHLRGENAYFKFVRSRYTKIRKNQQNLFVFGSFETDRSTSLERVVSVFLERYFVKATHDIVPLTIVAEDEVVQKIKAELIKDGCIFNDGYEDIQFSETLLFRNPVKTKKIVGTKASDTLDQISHKVNLVSKASFLKIKSPPKFSMIHYFQSDDLFGDIEAPFVKIIGLNLRQISELINF